jgi:hypothetical protein
MGGKMKDKLKIGSREYHRPFYRYLGTVYDQCGTPVAHGGPEEMEVIATALNAYAPVELGYDETPYTTTTHIAPKPCPFCGSELLSIEEGSTFRWRKPVCSMCDASSGEVRIAITEPLMTEGEIRNLVITEWNKRAGDNRDE